MPLEDGMRELEDKQLDYFKRIMEEEPLGTIQLGPEGMS